MKSVEHKSDDSDAKSANSEDSGVVSPEEVAPIGQLSRAVRADVGRLRQVWRTVRTPFEMVGLGLVTVAGVVGVITVLVVGFHDWYMHLGMHLVMLALALLYLRAYSRRRKLRRAGYALVVIGMYLFFAWALYDLAPPRLEIAGDLIAADGAVVPQVAMRGSAFALKVVAAMLTLSAAWVGLHWAILPRKLAKP